MPPAYGEGESLSSIATAWSALYDKRPIVLTDPAALT